MITPSNDPRPLSQRLQELSPERRAAVEKLWRERLREKGAALSLPANELWPLSFGQRRLWFVVQLDPSSSVYNTVNAVSLTAPIDLNALREALEALVARHESLRTTFEAVNGEPFQRVHGQAKIAIELGSPTTDFVRRPFDLKQGPLVRLCVETETGRVTACVHHLVTDGWSMGIFLREMSALYTGRLRGVPVKLVPLALQYKDYATLQRQELSGPRLAELLDFWRIELANLPTLDLATDRPRAAAPSFNGGLVPIRIQPETVGRLRKLALEQGATLFMAVLAGFSVLLSRYAGQDDIVIGSPVAGRTRSETENLIGFFINTIVLRSDLRGDPSFRELLTRTRDRAIRAYAHQDLPFERLVEDLQPDRDLSYNPLFQVVLHLVDHSSDQRSSDNADYPQVSTGTSPFDLVVHLRGTGTELKGEIEYRSDIFDQSSMERMAGHLAVLLEALVDDPEAPLSRSQMLSPGEKRELDEFNSTATRTSSEGIVELIDLQASRTPEAIAVGTLTYQALVQAANGVAHHLLGCGAGPETLVAISLPPGADLVTALLGIWKAGAAYLPLDPADPPARREQILNDARPLLILDHLHQFGSPRPDPPPVFEDPGRLAYIIYTSGSTGGPKGVRIEHRSLSNLVAWHLRKYQVTVKDRATLIASPAFDASVWELWPYLTVGAQILIPPSRTQSPSELLAWLSAERITITFLATPLAEAVLAEPLPTGLELRLLLTGGDRLHRLPQRSLPFVLVNHYGPTETTVVATACEIQTGAVEGQPPIGRPIDNVQAMVMDQHGHPLPIGVSGELWIAGAGLARGYLRRPELDTERFVERGGQRWYRTGDRTRRRSDGTLDFLGRLDQQIKLRGFRIEPGEIESHLQTHPCVRQAAVAERSGRLVAFVVLSAPLEEADSLKIHLRGWLPAYMVPTRFQILDALPINSNGKIDRQALPLPIFDESIYVAPRTSAERTIADLWAGLLGRERVSVYDDFFELGGHSLLATQVVSRVRSILDVEISVTTVFDAPTVASFAIALEKASRSSAGPSPTITRAPRESYRARLGADGKPVLNQPLRRLLHLDDPG